MRTTTRLCLVASIIAAVCLAAVPMANAAKAPGSVNITGAASHHNDDAQNKKIRKARRKANRAHARIRNLKEWNQSLSDWNTSQESTIASIQSTVGAIVSGVPTITNALTQLQGGLLALQAALEGPIATAFADIENGFGDVEDALNDPTTGLVGLNLARPQFGVLAADASFLGGTGAAGGQGPVDDSDTHQGPTAAPVVGDIDGLYVVDFNNDVSLRMYSVNVFPLGPTGAGGGAVVTASAANCAASTGVADLCGLVQLSSGGSGASDPDPNKVLVQIGDGTDGAGDAPNGFSVTAISG